MLLKRYAIPLVLALATAGGPASAAEEAPPAAPAEQEEESGSWLPGEFSGTVALTSNYLFRGISQTNNEPAIQGSLTYTLDTGLLGTSIYGGVWGSNVDFQDGDEAQVELDWNFGLTGTIGDTGIGWSLGGVYYNYPGARGSLNYDYWEIWPGLTYSPVEWLALSFGMPYSPDFFGASGDSFYPNGSAVFTVPGIPTKWFTLKLNSGIGYQAIDDNDRFGTPSYLTWTLGFTVNVKGVDATFAYVDTDISKRDCFAQQNLCETKFVGTLSYAF
jgi:uncharacterized protein (TIGR02001 family)